MKSLRSEGELVYFVSSDIYNAYIEELDQKGVDAAYNDIINGHATLYYHGIPVVEVALALNTSDMPENEVRMWYNPDEMENRQRAVFLAGADIIDQRLISVIYSNY